MYRLKRHGFNIQRWLACPKDCLERTCFDILIQIHCFEKVSFVGDPKQGMQKYEIICFRLVYCSPKCNHPYV